MSDENMDLKSLQLKYQPRMSPNTPGKLKYGRTFLIGLAFMTSSIAWSYYNFMLPILLEEYLTDMGVTTGLDTLIGFIMVLDNIIAILLLPYFGALSDRAKSKHGKRTPFIMIGCASAIVAFSVIGLISSSSGIGPFIALIAVVMWFNLSMAFYRSCSVSLMPDLTDPEVRSTGNAVINIMGALSMVLGLMISPIMGMIYDVNTPEGVMASRASGFYFVSVVTAVALLALLLTIKETPTGDKFLEIGDHSIAIDPITLEYMGEKDVEGKEPILQSLKNVFRSKEKSALYMLLTIFFFFFGYSAIDAFYSLYSTLYLGWAEGSASFALSVAPMTMVLTGVFAGLIAQKIGRKKTILIGLAGFSITFLVSMFISSPTGLTVIFGIIGVFYGFVNINTIVMIWEMAPEGKVGSYTGAYYFFSQFAATLSPVFAGASFDLYKLLPSVAHGEQYVLLFPYIIVCEIIAMFFLFKVKTGESASIMAKQGTVNPE